VVSTLQLHRTRRLYLSQLILDSHRPFSYNLLTVTGELVRYSSSDHLTRTTNKGGGGTLPRCAEAERSKSALERLVLSTAPRCSHAAGALYDRGQRCRWAPHQALSESITCIHSRSERRGHKPRYENTATEFGPQLSPRSTAYRSAEGEFTSVGVWHPWPPPLPSCPWSFQPHTNTLPVASRAAT